MKMKIKNANPEVLKVAMAALTTHLKGEQVSVIDIWRGTTEKVMFGIQAEGMTKGYGVNIKDGEITIIGDSYGQTIRQQNFAGKVEQFYKAAGINMALRKLNYGVQTRVQGTKVHVMGVNA